MRITRLAIAVLGLGAGLAACGPARVHDDGAPPDRVRPEAKYLSSAATHEDFCDRCNLYVYSGHRCGRTAPCRLCRREQGARHVHEVRRNCEPCQWVQREWHVCNDSKNCDQCRTDSRGPLGERPCVRCYRSLKAAEIAGVTTYCGECNYEVGANHICGKTTFCLTCLREAGSGHVHDATRLCGSCEAEAAIDHQHGDTAYCRECHRDAGPDHRHGETIWCIRCAAEEIWPHSYHR